MSDYSWKEMMAVVFSREIKDTDKITSGAHTEIFFAATMLAQKTHAPNLKLQLGGSVTLCQVTDIDVPELPKTSTGYELIRYAESVHDHPDTYSVLRRAGRHEVLQGRQRVPRRQPFLVRRQILRRRHPGRQVGQHQHDRARRQGRQDDFPRARHHRHQRHRGRRARHLRVHHRARQAPPGREGRLHLASRARRSAARTSSTAAARSGS